MHTWVTNKIKDTSRTEEDSLNNIQKANMAFLAYFFQGVVPTLASRRASVLPFISSPGVWNSAGGMNSVLPKYIASFIVLMMLVENAI